MSLREDVARGMTATLSCPWEEVCEEDRLGLLLYADAAIAIVLERAEDHIRAWDAWKDPDLPDQFMLGAEWAAFHISSYIRQLAEDTTP